MVNVVVCWVLTGVTWDVPGIAGKKKRLTLLAVLLGDQRHFFQCCCWLLEDVIQCRRVKATCGSPRNLSIPSLLSERSEHICLASSVLLRFLQVIPVPFILSKVDFSLYPQIFSEECYTISQMSRYNSFLHKILWVFKDEKRISSTVSTLQSFLRPRPLQGNDRSIQT